MYNVDDSFMPGDIIWQSRMPGGVCILLAVYDSPSPEAKHAMVHWADHDYPIFELWHPEEGRIVDPSYYYRAIGDVESFKQQLQDEAAEIRAIGESKV